MNCEHLESDELIIEFEIRNIHGSILSQLTSLKMYLEDENNHVKNLPENPHESALRNPAQEVILCITKLKVLHAEIKNQFESDSFEFSDFFESLKSRLLHILSRARRMSHFENIQPTTNAIITTCSVLLENIVKVQRKEISVQDSRPALDDMCQSIADIEGQIKQLDEVDLTKSPTTPDMTYLSGRMHHSSKPSGIQVSEAAPNVTTTVTTVHAPSNMTHVNSLITNARNFGTPMFPTYPTSYPPMFPQYMTPFHAPPPFFHPPPPVVPNLSQTAPVPEPHHSRWTSQSKPLSKSTKSSFSTPRPQTVSPAQLPANLSIGLDFSSTKNLNELTVATADPNEKLAEISGLLNDYLSQMRNITFAQPEAIQIASPPPNIHTVENNTFTITQPSIVPNTSTTTTTSSSLRAPNSQNVNQTSASSVTNSKTSNIILKWNISFDGSTKDIAVERFLFRVEFLAAAFEISEDQLVKNLGFLLKGPAKEFYWVVVEKTARTGLTWKQLRCVFVNQYQDRRTDSDIRHMLDLRKQKFKEAIQDFYNDLLAISLPLRVPLNDLEILELIKRNMRYGLQTAVAGESFKSLPEFLHKLIAIEDSWNRIGYVPETAMFPKYGGHPSKVAEMESNTSVSNSSPSNVVSQAQCVIPQNQNIAAFSNVNAPRSSSNIPATQQFGGFMPISYDQSQANQCFQPTLPVGYQYYPNQVFPSAYNYQSLPVNTNQSFENFNINEVNVADASVQNQSSNLMLSETPVSFANNQFITSPECVHNCGVSVEAIGNQIGNSYQQSSSNNQTSTSVQPSQYVPPLGCFNCGQTGHGWVECPSPYRRLFCYSCGWINTVKPKCPYCQLMKQQSGNTKPGVMNKGATYLPNNKTVPRQPFQQQPQNQAQRQQTFQPPSNPMQQHPPQH